MMLFFRLLSESFSFAFSALRQNKLRTVLSLVGVTIGIFVIIFVFSGVDTLRANLQKSVEKLGSNTIYVQKWPWLFDNNYPWWKYVNRPNPDLRDYARLQERLEGAEGIAFEVGVGNRTIKYKSNSVEGAQLSAASHDLIKVRETQIDLGRYFSDNESRSGSPVAIIGADIADGLFPNMDPLGKNVKIFGRNIRVIGIFKKEGEDMLGVSNDKTIQLPLNFVKGVIDVRSDRYGPQITAKGKENIPLEEFESELRGVMRSIHRLSPTEEDDFSLNKTTMLTAQLDTMFQTVNAAGLFIGIFSILVGGFGIANIMFVSVKERTNIIGIQKSLGAKNYFILFQFLIEAILLCLMGGLLGLAGVYLISGIIKLLADVAIIVSIGKVIGTFILCSVIGLLAGFIPAFMAARLNPVEAIRSK
jgi:putative ABC transport system permease protein